MTKEEFIKMVMANVKSKQWLNGTFDVEGKKVGVKAFGFWVQQMSVQGCYWKHTGTSFNNTQKALKIETSDALDKMFSEANK